MLKIARVLLLGLLLVVWFVVGLLLCIVRPRNPNNVYAYAWMYHHIVCPCLGIKVEITIPEANRRLGSAVYICNHQSNYDIFIATGAVLPGVVAVGKKSLLWLPFFGVLFWLSGNILIDRGNHHKARNTINQVVKRIREGKISVWMFPEGTRSKGRGLLPFKAGAFHTAVQAKVPLVPIVCSNYFGKIDLNRWDNGTVRIEMMEPLTQHLDEEAPIGAKELLEVSRSLMVAKLEELDQR